jgi:pyridinium-3,5-biscarboxylic acid mononucleotide synthase
LDLRELIDSVIAGTMSVEAAEEYLRGHGIAAVGHHRLDLHRGGRAAVPEVIFGLSKPVEQLLEIAGAYAHRGLPLLITKVDQEKAHRLAAEFPQLEFDPVSMLASLGESADPVGGSVALLTAGSSDLPVAEEAAGTLRYFGVDVVRHYDSGVAGLHRLFAGADAIAAADVVIVVAGMDGALPSVVGGLFRQPVIAVPTSVGYGASFDGLAALLTMLNSCAPGVTVVNIDNGFGAAVAAVSMLRMTKRRAGGQAVLSAEMEENE